MATKKLESYPSMINTLVFEKRGGETSDSKKQRIRENPFFSLAPTKARWAKRERDKTTRSETILVTVIV